MRILPILFLLVLSKDITAQDKPKTSSIADLHYLIPQNPEVTKEIKEAVIKLNTYRRAAGLDTVVLSPELSKKCEKHAIYLTLNKNHPKTEGLQAHHEDKGLTGYSADGDYAAKHSDIFPGTGPLKSVTGFINSFYHRIPLLQPNLRSIGIGYFELGNDYSVTVLDCISGVSGPLSSNVVFYPNADQKDVPIEMQPEIPDPTNNDGKAGYPITIYFANIRK
jgi:hypothetical protein